MCQLAFVSPSELISALQKRSGMTRRMLLVVAPMSMVSVILLKSGISAISASWTCWHQLALRLLMSFTC